MIKILFYPKEDEYLYSYLSRYHTYSLSNLIKYSTIDLFGKNIQFNFHFQQHIEELSKNTNGYFTTEFILNELLLVRLIKPFITPEKYEVVKSLHLNEGNGLYRTASFFSHNTLVKDNFSIKICPICFKEENNTDIAYIHRSHNAPGIQVCSKHHCFLQRVEFDKTTINGYININNVYEPKEVEFPSPELLEHFLKYNEDIDFILSGGLDNVSLDEISKKIEIKLNNKDIFRNNENELNELQNDIKQFYSEKFLDLMDSELDKRTLNKSLWTLSTLFFFQRQQSIIHRLLIIRFLFGSVENLVSFNEVFEPFKNLPYECMNKLCSSYNKRIIKSYKITKKQNFKRLDGKFTCPECSYSYIINALTGEKTPSYKNQKEQTQYRIALSKHIFLKKMQENPELSRDELRKLIPKSMNYLFVYARDWITENLPERRKNPWDIGKYCAIDWNEREAELYPIVEKIINNILRNNLPVRITKILLKQETGYIESFDKRYIRRMPRLEKLVNESLENAERYRNRRKQNSNLKKHILLN